MKTVFNLVTLKTLFFLPSICYKLIKSNRLNLQKKLKKFTDFYNTEKNSNKKLTKKIWSSIIKKLVFKQLCG